ncbi:MAG TPA: helix-turn-helix domain-containing protein [Conexibacter sp.]|jgi:hypothetical protein|nr:helix-turn-helix domain-containing protein [Conexibacter sp.]
MERSDSLQALVEALSLALERPVLLDDADLRPLAYSSQWGEIDPVRSESIMRRGASPAVRRALQAQGIAQAQGVLRTRPEPQISMEERVCAPVRSGANVLGYLWLLDAHHELVDEQLERIATTARRVAQVLGAPVRRPVDEGALLARLCSPQALEREAAAAVIRDRRLLPDRPLVVCAVAPRTLGADALVPSHRMAGRLSAGRVLLGTLPTAIALLVSLEDPVVTVLHEDEIASWLLGGADGEVAIGQSARVAGLLDVADGWRHACIALGVALVGATGSRPLPHAAWTHLGAERLIAQLPASAARDVPERLARVLRDEPTLTETLAAFLDSAGDVKATASALSLHRSGLYYRLHRIEELTGLRLDRGDDRLLAHIAVRLMRLD